MFKTNKPRSTIFKSIALFVLLAFTLPELTHPSLSFLAPPTNAIVQKSGVTESVAKPLKPLTLSIKKERLVLTPRNIFTYVFQGQDNHFVFNQKKSNAFFEALEREKVNSHEHFVRLLQPFEIFLETHQDHYFFAMAFSLILDKAPNSHFKDRILRKLLIHVPQIQQARDQKDPEQVIRKKSYWANMLSNALAQINYSNTKLTQATATELEQALVTRPVSPYEGARTLSVRDNAILYFVKNLDQVRTRRLKIRLLPHVLRAFNKEPSGAQIHFLLDPLFKNPKVIEEANVELREFQSTLTQFFKKEAQDQLLKETLLITAEPKKEAETSEETVPSQEEVPELTEEEKIWAEFKALSEQAIPSFRQDFLDLTNAMAPAIRTQPITLHRRFITETDRTTPKHTELVVTYDDGAIKGEHFLIKHGGRRVPENQFALAVIPENAPTRTIMVTFSYLTPSHPTPIVFETINEEGEFISEEVFIHSDMFLTFERRENEIIEFKGNEVLIKGEQVFFTKNKVLHLNLAKLAQLLGKHSVVLSSFYKQVTPKKKPGRLRKPKVKVKKPKDKKIEPNQQVQLPQRKTGTNAQVHAWPLFLFLLADSGFSINLSGIGQWLWSWFFWTHPALIGAGLILAYLLAQELNEDERGDALLTSFASILIVVSVTFLPTVFLLSIAVGIFYGTFLLAKKAIESLKKFNETWLKTFISNQKTKAHYIAYLIATQFSLSPQLHPLASYTELLESLFNRGLWKEKVLAYKTRFSWLKEINEIYYRNYLFRMEEMARYAAKPHFQGASFYAEETIALLDTIKEETEQEFYSALIDLVTQKKEKELSEEEYSQKMKETNETLEAKRLMIEEEIARLYVFASYHYGKSNQYSKAAEALKKSIFMLTRINQKLHSNAAPSAIKTFFSPIDEHFWRTLAPNFLSQAYNRISHWQPPSQKIPPSFLIESSL